MGSIWFSGRGVVDSIAELIGYKLGLVVSEEDLATAVASHGLAELWPLEMDASYRYRSEVLEELAHRMLAAFGDADAASMLEEPLVVRRLVREFPELAEDFGPLDYTLDRLPQLKPPVGSNLIDPGPLLDEVEEQWGPRGVVIASRLMLIMDQHMVANPWSRIRREEYASRAVLRDLFTSENLPLPLGLFFDQRFIDYLDANSTALEEMHWRQFEGLVAERLRREGLRVELGPGRADEGVDVRAWDPDAGSDAPAVMLVQCKRTRSKVDRVVVKALAADVDFEGARQGMVATTSSWSPGARHTVESRGYPVEEANRDTLITWLTQMRTPGTGVWLAGSTPTPQ
ncbi:restriction endonuclease [Kitasatospora sp. NPDC048298]|uniref:restriction endonuclease n=1 Tax=Kitasatospora sp. NPDC048298 TaxID=3364049 RepID=UPI003718BC8E